MNGIVTFPSQHDLVLEGFDMCLGIRLHTTKIMTILIDINPFKFECLTQPESLVLHRDDLFNPRGCQYRLFPEEDKHLDDLICHKKIHEYEEQGLILIKYYVDYYAMDMSSPASWIIRCNLPTCPCLGHGQISENYIESSLKNRKRQRSLLDWIKLHSEWKSVSYEEIKRTPKSNIKKKLTKFRKESCRVFNQGKIS